MGPQVLNQNDIPREKKTEEIHVDGQQISSRIKSFFQNEHKETVPENASKKETVEENYNDVSIGWRKYLISITTESI